MQTEPLRSVVVERRSDPHPDRHEFEPGRVRTRSRITGDRMAMRGLGFAVPMAALIWLATLLLFVRHIGN